MTKTRIIGIDPAGENADPVRAIAAALLEDAVAAYPTETFYALGAAAFSRGAVEKVYRLKRRDMGKPLSVVVSDLDMVREISAPLPPSFRALAGEFWPGPLTLVLLAAARLPDFMLGPGRTIAVRIPPLPWLRALVREISEPLTATSANLSGEKELADPAEVAAVFRGKVDVIVDGGPAPGGAPSTIVDLTSPEPRILRPGKISEARIRAVLES
ncbi:MAG: threonylcarbamoyl-AMP synthase [Acidobacteria bacterium]|nr:threonylcarbamoyl-AMP synthase [Acidobacteriota bacterium]MBE3129344.1 threonylcarbamoyl-AMP synthase [Acidobacteriota bacterium]